MAEFILSAFGDEIDDDLDKQLSVLVSEGVRHLELRGAWGRNVLDLDAAQLKRAGAVLKTHGCALSAIGSPVGKSDIAQPREFEWERLDRAINAANALGTRLIRVFSYYIPKGEAATYRNEVLERMALLTERAAATGMTLVHENERAIYGDLPERCRDILVKVSSPNLRAAFDPANFVVDKIQPMVVAWPLLAEFTTHIHVKDAVFADGSIRPAGEGDGDVPGLLRALVERDYHGFLTLEPHLKMAGQYGGLSGEDGMRTAIRALRKLIEQLPQDQVVTR
ncbi:MAG: sugar phosphate isomerase/epimerase [Chloroflexi bacterium]|nr:sugar phosphate isomerase/epimerase [Chloroflexota bacterium]